MKLFAIAFALALPISAADPQLPHKVVQNWAQLPAGWNFGECSGVDVDKDDNVWIFNRGTHPVMQFDHNGKLVQAWTDVPIKSSHGIRVGPDGNIWAIDVKGHALVKFNPLGRVLEVIAQAGNKPGNNDSKDAFNEPTGIAWAKNGDFYISDGYQNSRVVKFSKDFDYLTHWGKKGTGDGEFNLVHDVAVDTRGRVYVADRNNNRIQVFDADGNFLSKWTKVATP